jgi:hypothetical protein
MENSVKKTYYNHILKTHKMKNFKQSIIALTIATFCFTTGEAQTNAKTQSGIKIGGMNEMPSSLRTSMNVTVGKQTIQVAVVDGGCVISAPLQKAYRVTTSNNTITEISQAEFGERVNAGKQTQGATFGEKVNVGLQQAGSVVSSGAGMLGGALPGGSIVSASVSSVSNMANMGGAASASYAATGRTAGWDLRTTETRLQLPESLPDGDYELTFVIEQSKSGLRDTLKTQVRLAFTLTQGVLKTKHDTVKNSISNVR